MTPQAGGGVLQRAGKIPDFPAGPRHTPQEAPLDGSRARQAVYGLGLAGATRKRPGPWASPWEGVRTHIRGRGASLPPVGAPLRSPLCVPGKVQVLGVVEGVRGQEQVGGGGALRPDDRRLYPLVAQDLH